MEKISLGINLCLLIVVLIKTEKLINIKQLLYNYNYITIILHITDHTMSDILNIETIYEEYDDKRDILDITFVNVPSSYRNCFIAFKEDGEYGINITIFRINTKDIHSVFISNYSEKAFNEREYFISSSTFHRLNEKIFSNFTEYFFDNKFISYRYHAEDDNLIINEDVNIFTYKIKEFVNDDNTDNEIFLNKLTREINKDIFERMLSPELLKFIESDKQATIISEHSLDKLLYIHKQFSNI